MTVRAEAFDFRPTLRGDLIALRPAAPEDFDALYAAASDPEIWALHPARDRWREPVFRAFFDAAFADEGGLVVTDRETDAVVGFSRYSMTRAERGEIEIGWTFLARHCWGGRVNGEMKRLMLAHAFRFVDTVIFQIGVDNLRSRRAIEKLGSHLTDRTEAVSMGGADVPHVVYAIRRTDWVIGRQRAACSAAGNARHFQ